MVAVTERAAEQLREMLAASATDPKQLVRLDADHHGFFLRVDLQQEGDDVLESGDTAILLITSRLNLAFADATVDCVDTPVGPRLTVLKGDEPSR